MRAQTVAKSIASLTMTKKADDVVLMDLRGLTSMADFFVICSADSDVQVRAIADAVEDGMEKKGLRLWHRESGSSNWILLDFVDVVLHIFHKNTRPFYNLEKLWGDAKTTRLDDRGAARLPARGTRRKRPASPRKTIAS